MPCIKCSNGKWKIGQKGKCVYKTKKKCEQALAAIHSDKNKKDTDKTKDR